MDRDRRDGERNQRIAVLTLAAALAIFASVVAAVLFDSWLAVLIAVLIAASYFGLLATGYRQ